MQLLYSNEHLSCHYYQHGEKAAINLFQLVVDETVRRVNLDDTVLIFVLEGSCLLTCNQLIDKVIEKGECFLLPPKTVYQIISTENLIYIAVSFQTRIQLCEVYSLEQLYPYCQDIQYTFCVLPFKDQIVDYLSLLKQYLKDKINCSYFLELKTQELFYLFRVYYSKEDLASFFYPILSQDIAFKSFVMENCLATKTVKELAELANYSTSGFIKKFIRCFNEAPYKWIENFKAEKILHDINLGSKGLKEIAMDYNFSSLPHFIKFCKRKYGATPGIIRKNRLQKINT